jgi:glycosyltransferase involved in cell wall biosynthesis
MGTEFNANKCDLVIYTTMPSNNWGGSEELWFLFAKYTLIKGKRIIICTEFYKELHVNYKHLSDLGADVRLIYSQRKYSILHKIKNKINRWFNHHSNTPQHYFEILNCLKKYNPTYFLVNQGGTFSFYEDKLILFLLENFKSRYMLISQHNHEYFTYQYDYLKNLRREVNKFEKFFFVSERNYHVALRQLAQPIFPEIHFIQNPCKIKLNSPLAYPVSDQINIAFIGRLECRNKGLDVLIDSLSNECFKNYHWKLELWGEGSDKEYLTDLVNYYDLSHNIFFMGYTKDITNIWKSNQMLILPSYNEGTPLVILETMMCGRAVFTSDVGDNSKFVFDGENGFLIPYATKKVLVSKLIEAFNKRKHWQQMGYQSHEAIKSMIIENPAENLFKKIFN